MLRKGMSPLIATVLLIAFAVALGAMIMNWSSGMDPPSPAPSKDPCRDVQLELSEVFGKPLFCYRDDQIVFNVVNKGSREIRSVQIIVIDDKLVETKQDLPSSSLIVGETFSGSFPFSRSGLLHVKLVPKIIQNNEPMFCQDRAVVLDVLPSCD
jgi:flagellin-like protein